MIFLTSGFFPTETTSPVFLVLVLNFLYSILHRFQMLSIFCDDIRNRLLVGCYLLTYLYFQHEKILTTVPIDTVPTVPGILIIKTAFEVHGIAKGLDFF